MKLPPDDFLNPHRAPRDAFNLTHSYLWVPSTSCPEMRLSGDGSLQLSYACLYLHSPYLGVGNVTDEWRISVCNTRCQYALHLHDLWIFAGNNDLIYVHTFAIFTLWTKSLRLPNPNRFHTCLEEVNTMLLRDILILYIYICIYMSIRQDGKYHPCWNTSRDQSCCGSGNH